MNSGLVCLLLVSTTLALGQKKDVNGWDKIKWGMTLEQAASAYNLEYKPETNEYWMTLDLPSITVAGINLEVNCGAKHGTDSITLVRMSDFRNPSPGNRDTIKTLLIQKYGQPNSQDENTVLWVLSSTSITLEVNRFGWVNVTYKAIEKNSLFRLLKHRCQQIRLLVLNHVILALVCVQPVRRASRPALQLARFLKKHMILSSRDAALGT